MGLGIRARYARLKQWAVESEQRERAEAMKSVRAAAAKGWLEDSEPQSADSARRHKLAMMVTGVGGLLLLVAALVAAWVGISVPLLVGVLVFVGVGLLLSAVGRAMRYLLAHDKPDEDAG